ncbi:hypothetical protein [Marinobacter sp.]|uniref:hypothetical protein n=1 Tax=Marinobacter sp. TaxID=50741 RepID=UPI003B525150
MLHVSRLKAEAGALYENVLLMRAFAEQQQEQIQDYSKNLEKYIKEEEIETIITGRENKDEIEKLPARHIAGVFEHNLDLTATFEGVMPIYQNQATLISLWSTFESGTFLVAQSLSAEKNTRLRRKESGISSVAHYLNEIDRLGLKHRNQRMYRTDCEFLSLIVGRIRNAWVHNGGRCKNKSVSEIVRKDSDLLVRNNLIKINHSFLFRVIESMRSISEEIYLLSSRQRNV